VDTKYGVKVYEVNHRSEAITEQMVYFVIAYGKLPPGWNGKK
jgi:hypothetical protein